MTTLVDAAKVAAFQERMVDILNWSFLGLAISVGHHVGLFDVMAGGSWAPADDPQWAALDPSQRRRQILDAV
jgi:hypothetical protein